MAELVSQSEYARRRDVSRQYVNKLVQQGRIPTDEKKRIDPDTADAVLQMDADPARRLNDPEQENVPDPANSFEEEAAGGASGGHTSFARFRSAREAYQAKLAQLDYEERAGQLLRKSEVERETFDVARQVRDRFLALPQELAGALVKLADENEIKKYLRAKIRDTLMEVADDVGLGT